MKRALVQQDEELLIMASGYKNVQYCLERVKHWSNVILYRPLGTKPKISALNKLQHYVYYCIIAEIQPTLYSYLASILYKRAQELIKISEQRMNLLLPKKLLDQLITTYWVLKTNIGFPKEIVRIIMGHVRSGEPEDMDFYSCMTYHLGPVARAFSYLDLYWYHAQQRGDINIDIPLPFLNVNILGGGGGGGGKYLYKTNELNKLISGVALLSGKKANPPYAWSTMSGPEGQLWLARHELLREELAQIPQDQADDETAHQGPSKRLRTHPPRK